MDTEKIESNWETFERLLKRLSDDNLNTLLEQLGERIAVCPLSMKKDQGGAYPGALVEHSLDVTLKMRTLNESLELGLPMNSILKVGLLHDLGKIGDLENDYFIVQESEWHREKLGQMYTYSENIQKMSPTHRTLFLLQHFNVSLTEEEWLAVQLSGGSHLEENRFYVRNEPTISLILQQAKSLSMHKIQD
jgi:hypothetical protein